MDSINVLVIEDNPADARLIREGFAELTQPELKVFYADRLATGLDQLLAEPIQVVLLVDFYKDESLLARRITSRASVISDCIVMRSEMMVCLHSSIQFF